MVRSMVLAGVVAGSLAVGATVSAPVGAPVGVLPRAAGGMTGVADDVGAGEVGAGAVGLGRPPQRGVGDTVQDVLASVAGDAPPAPGGGATGPRLPPLHPPLVVVRPFDGPAERWHAGHRGVDLSADPGQAVRAPAAGVVTFAGVVVDRGVVTVTHPDGLRTSLEPVRSAVAAGARVVPGQTLGAVTADPGHCAPDTCLHWGLRRGEAYLDPLRWLADRGPVVLLPLG